MEKSLILLVFLPLLWFSWQKYWSKPSLVILPGLRAAAVGQASLLVEIADNNEAITRGLSGRKELPKNSGLLFVFRSPGNYSFWMKEMHFPLDIIWFGADKKVVGFSENVSPESFPRTYPPPSPVQFVLEVNAGWVRENRLRVGDVLSVPNDL